MDDWTIYAAAAGAALLPTAAVAVQAWLVSRRMDELYGRSSDVACDLRRFENLWIMERELAGMWPPLNGWRRHEASSARFLTSEQRFRLQFEHARHLWALPDDQRPRWLDRPGPRFLSHQWLDGYDAFRVLRQPWESTLFPGPTDAKVRFGAKLDPELRFRLQFEHARALWALPESERPGWLAPAVSEGDPRAGQETRLDGYDAFRVLASSSPLPPAAL